MKRWSWRLGASSLLRRLLLEGAERSELTLRVDDLLHRGGTEGADQLVLQVGDAHVEAERFHVGAGQVGAEAGPLEPAPEVALLGGVAQPRQPDVEPRRTERGRGSGRCSSRRPSARPRCPRRRGPDPGARPAPPAPPGRWPPRRARPRESRTCPRPLRPSFQLLSGRSLDQPRPLTPGGDCVRRTGPAPGAGQRTDLARRWARSPCGPNRLRTSTGAVVGAAEPVRDAGVELGRFAGGEDEVLLAEHQPQPPAEHVEPLVALMGVRLAGARLGGRRG